MGNRLRLLHRLRRNENSVERQCCDWLRVRHYYPIRLQSGLLRTRDDRLIRIGVAGLPDYVVIHPRFPAFFLETKRPGGAMTPDQKTMAWKLAGYGLPVAKADDVAVLQAWVTEHEQQACEKWFGITAGNE